MLLGWAYGLMYRIGQLYSMPIVTMLIAAYASGYLVKNVGLHPAIALIVSIVLGTLLAAIFAPRIAKLADFSTALVTIAVLFVAQQCIANLSFLGGRRGMVGIPTIQNLWMVCCVVAVVVGYIMYRLDSSAFGRKLDLIFVSPNLAEATGIDVKKVSMYLQVAAGGMGAMAGFLYAMQVRTLRPDIFGFNLIVLCCVFLFVGGYSTMWGVVVSTPVLWAISVYLPSSVAEWKVIIYGCLLVVILLVRPGGLIDRRLVVGVNGRLKRMGVRGSGDEMVR